MGSNNKTRRRFDMNDTQLREMKSIELKIKKLQNRLDYLKMNYHLEEQERLLQEEFAQLNNNDGGQQNTEEQEQE
jgi:hypothetical protein